MRRSIRSKDVLGELRSIDEKHKTGACGSGMISAGTNCSSCDSILTIYLAGLIVRVTLSSKGHNLEGCMSVLQLLIYIRNGTTSTHPAHGRNSKFGTEHVKHLPPGLAYNT